MLDVVIIGAGPVGLACGIEARREGLEALLIDKGALVNSFLGYPVNLEFFSTPELMEIGGHPFATLRYKPLREEAIEYYRRVAAAEHLTLRLYERVLRVDGEDGGFTVVTEKDRYACRKVVAAVGFFDVPNRLGVPGEDLPNVTHYYREPYAYAGQKVAVIGAKNSAAKVALDCYRHGAAVTLIHRGPTLSDKIKYWIRPDLENRIREGSIAVFFNTTVAAVERDRLLLDTPEGRVDLPNDWVLAMTGYRPDYPFLETLAINAEDDEARTPVYDPETFETNRPGLYLAGTVCGGLRTGRWFIENGRFHAGQIMKHIAHGTVKPLALEERYWKTAE
jgi:thioredoxin reductase (NADPH)